MKLVHWEFGNVTPSKRDMNNNPSYTFFIKREENAEEVWFKVGLT